MPTKTQPAKPPLSLAEEEMRLAHVRDTHRALEEARGRFMEALTVATEDGISAQRVGDACGISRQRVWQIVNTQGTVR